MENPAGQSTPAAATGRAHGHLQAQDGFLLQLFIHKAPKTQNLWLVQMEMLHLLIEDLGHSHAQASAHSSFLKSHPGNPSHDSLGFYRVLSSSDHQNWEDC